MDLPDNLLQYIKEEALRIGQYGKIIIEPGEDKVDVITQVRKRFKVKEKESNLQSNQEKVYHIDPA